MGADTSFLTNNALTKKVWAESLYRDALKSTFLTNMIGTGSDSIIQLKNELSKGKGDVVTFGLRVRELGHGQSSSTTGAVLEGNEVAMQTYDFSVTLEEKANAIKAQSKLTLKRPAFDVKAEMKETLKDWLADELEYYMLSKLLATPSANRYFESTSVLKATDLEMLNRQAKLASPMLRPVNIKGKKYYVFLAHPYALKGLKADDDFRNACTLARDRGIDNPIIQGADYVYDGILIYEYNRDGMLQTGGICRSLLLGAQAGALAWGQKPAWYEKDFDYDRVPGVATDMLIGFGKTKFNSEDYGCMAIDSTYVADGE